MNELSYNKSKSNFINRTLLYMAIIGITNKAFVTVLFLKLRNGKNK